MIRWNRFRQRLAEYFPMSAQLLLFFLLLLLMWMTLIFISEKYQDSVLPTNVTTPVDVEIHKGSINLIPGKPHETVTVYFATDRNFTTQESKRYFLWVLVAGCIVSLLCFLLIIFEKRRKRIKALHLFLLCIFIGVFCSFSLYLFLNPPTKGIVFGSNWGDLTLGWCEIGIPESHRRGNLERPKNFLGLEMVENPEDHIVLLPPQRLNEESFYEAIKRSLERYDPEILVFVHGFNVSFEEAARRTGQLAYDLLPFNGVASFFSWPSQGELSRYFDDAESVKYAEEHFRKYLLMLAEQTDAKRIHLIAHSMGNRLMTEALSDVVRTLDSPNTKFTQLILTAPDIGREYFLNTVLPELSENVGRITLYASSKDKALKASTSLQANQPRAGDAAYLIIDERLQTIDASNVNTDFLSHGYFADSEAVVSDIFGTIRGLDPDDRPGLRKSEKIGIPFWTFIE